MAALQISSAIYWATESFPRPFRQSCVVVLMASDNIKYWEPEDSTSFKGDISKFYSYSQLPNN